MELYITLVVASGLLILAAVTGTREYFARGQAAAEPKGNERQQKLQQSRFQRRMQVSVMLAALSVGLVVGQLISEEDEPILFLLFWSGLTVLILWIGLLAMVDLFRIRQHAADVARELLIQQIQLERKLGKRGEDQRTREDDDEPQ
ncbi:MAG: hypothetical protein N2C14_08805 [Planctomycetales bacterium]